MSDPSFSPRRAVTVPDKPALEGLEQKWTTAWEADEVYRFDRSRPRAEVYSIDTPPPTVSGSLHVGHVFSYTHTDTVARFQRMRGREKRARMFATLTTCSLARTITLSGNFRSPIRPGKRIGRAISIPMAIAQVVQAMVPP